jgi:thioredoxin-like negative regulator of GroEL
LINVSESELLTRLKSPSRPVAAAFVRKGAAPADALLSALKNAEPKLKGKLDVVQVDIDACASLVESLRIHRVPELLVWSPNAKLVARMEGAMSDEQVVDFLEHALTRF